MRWLPYGRLELETRHTPEDVVERLRRVTGKPRLFGLWLSRGGVRFRGTADGSHFEVQPVARVWNRTIARVVGDVRGGTRGSLVRVTIGPRPIDAVGAIVVTAALAWLGVSAFLWADRSWLWAVAPPAAGAVHLGLVLRSVHVTAALARRTLSELLDAELHASRG